MRFAEALCGLRKWLRVHSMFPRDDDPPIKITIEAPTPRIAAAMLYQFRSEFDQRVRGGYIDFDRPMMIMGMEVTFKIAPGRKMPDVYRRGLPGQYDWRTP